MKLEFVTIEEVPIDFTFTLTFEEIQFLAELVGHTLEDGNTTRDHMYELFNGIVRRGKVIYAQSQESFLGETR